MKKCNKSNKGFTLIELLAVIIILSIIFLIAAPTIMGVINNSKEKAAVNAAYGYLDAVEKKILEQMVIDETDPKVDNGTYTVQEGGTGKLTPTNSVPGEPADITPSLKGEAPKAGGTVTFENNKVTNASLTFFEIEINCPNGKCSKA